MKDPQAHEQGSMQNYFDVAIVELDIPRVVLNCVVNYQAELML